MTPEENRKRAQDDHVKFIKEHICDAKGDKSYVFISYKSDDWNVVLHDIVYRLVRDYGLNVYFDGSFESHNSLWIDQFPENMRSYKCKGVLAFLNDKYATSYATLLELMYSQTQKANKRVVPINLDRLTQIDGREGEMDTGLGIEFYTDSAKNVNAKTELDRFNKAFKELIRRKVLVDAQDWYEEGDRLTKKSCSEIVAELIAFCRVNDNHYEEGKPLDGIVDSIKDACGKDVFGKPIEIPSPEPVDTTSSNDKEKEGNNTEPLTGQGSKISDRTKHESEENGEGTGKDGEGTGKDGEGTGKDGEGTGKDGEGTKKNGKISFLDFLKKYDDKKFKKNTYACIKLTGLGEYAKYSTGFYDSSYDLTWAFVSAILRRDGEKYIRFVNDKNIGSANPPFITAKEHAVRKAQPDGVRYRKLDVEGLEGYSMCNNFSQYDWIGNVLKKRMQELGLPFDQFVLEYESGAEIADAPGSEKRLENPSLYVDTTVSSHGMKDDVTVEKKENDVADSVSSGGITGPVSLHGSEDYKGKTSKQPSSRYNFTLYGIGYQDLILKEMMLTIFITVINRHPDKINELIAKVACLAEGNKISKDGVPSTFHQGECIIVDGKEVSIGTSLNRRSVIGYIGKLMKICEEPADSLSIDGYTY